MSWESDCGALAANYDVEALYYELSDALGVPDAQEKPLLCQETVLLADFSGFGADDLAWYYDSATCAPQAGIL